MIEGMGNNFEFFGKHFNISPNESSVSSINIKNFPFLLSHSLNGREKMKNTVSYFFKNN